MQTSNVGVYKYVAVVDPPTLEDAWDAFCDEHGITPGQVIAVLGHRDRTVRERLRGDRKMSLAFLMQWCTFVGMDYNEAYARLVGQMKPTQIGAIQRAGQVGDERMTETLQ